MSVLSKASAMVPATIVKYVMPGKMYANPPSCDMAYSRRERVLSRIRVPSNYLIDLQNDVGGKPHSFCSFLSCSVS